MMTAGHEGPRKIVEVLAGGGAVWGVELVEEEEMHKWGFKNASLTT